MTTPPAQFLTVDVARRINGLKLSDLSAIITLTSNGHKPAAILEYARKIEAGEPVEISFKPGTVRPHIVQAWSMVNDKSQYYGVYGMTVEDAAALRETLLTDLTAGVQKVHAVVQRALDAKKSPRPIKIETAGMPNPSATSTSSSPSASNPELNALLAVIKAEPGRFGAYHFTPVEVVAKGAKLYQARLGENLYVRAQSKRMAELAAKIVSVYGRADPRVVNYCVAIAGSKEKEGAAIPDEVWDGCTQPFADKRPDLERVASTTVSK